MTFYQAFAANMAALGLPAPRGPFETLTTAVTTIVAINRTIATYGRNVTLRELLLTLPAFASAGAVVELGAVAASVTAAFYLGACLGSLLVATGHVVTHSTLTHKAARLGLSGPWLWPAFVAVVRRDSERRIA